MQNSKHLMRGLGSFAAALSVALLPVALFTGCQSGHEHSSDHMHAAPAATPAPAPVSASAPAAAAVSPVAAAPSAPAVLPTIRIKAGVSSPFTDSEGKVWLADQGFADGDTTDRSSDLQIANTKDPALYRSERYLMTKFSYPVPNGKYTVKLHFAETYEGITAAGERVFSFDVEGHEFKDFDIMVKAGGAQKAYVESVDVEVTDGKVDITFTPKVENPEINGIEILPRS